MDPNTTHDVYEHPDGRREIIKSGFSWPAFFFGPLWAWRKGMVTLGFGLLGLGLLLQLIPVLFIGLLGEAGIVVELFLSIGALIWIGSQGNTWRRTDVLNRGFKLRSTPSQTY